MKSSLLMILTVILGLVLFPLLAYAESAAADVGKAPISQPLVREGTLAVKLVDALELGPAANEAEAEGALANAGIAPRNGWIADYPVTPDIVGELQNAVSDAADSKQLSMGKDEALTAFQDVMVPYNMSIRPAGQGDGVTPTSSSPDSTVINNYYYDEGPPAVTYYTPPPDSYYLYSWVPYPFWWWNAWFPGFFVLADFDIVVDRHDGHHRHGEHREFVTNHFRDSSTGRMSRIDAANRAHGGAFSERGGSGRVTHDGNSGQAILNRSRGFVPAGGNGMAVSPSRHGRLIGSPTTSGAPLGRTSGSTSVTRRTSFSSSGGTFNAASAGRRAFASSPQSGASSTFSSRPSVSRSFSMPSGGGAFRGSLATGRTSGSFGGGSRGSFGGWHR